MSMNPWQLMLIGKERNCKDVVSNCRKQDFPTLTCEQLELNDSYKSNESYSNSPLERGNGADKRL